MIEVALNRTASRPVACIVVRQLEQKDLSHGSPDKSADVCRAHVVGWSDYLRCSRNLPAGASSQRAQEIKVLSAIADVEPILGLL
jgi:hypothetical protein